jgi:hypothetical protein
MDTWRLVVTDLWGNCRRLRTPGVGAVGNTTYRMCLANANWSTGMRAIVQLRLAEGFTRTISKVSASKISGSPPAGVRDRAARSAVTVQGEAVRVRPIE